MKKFSAIILTLFSAALACAQDASAATPPPAQPPAGQTPEAVELDDDEIMPPPPANVENMDPPEQPVGQQAVPAADGQTPPAGGMMPPPRPYAGRSDEGGPSLPPPGGMHPGAAPAQGAYASPAGAPAGAPDPLKSMVESSSSPAAGAPQAPADKPAIPTDDLQGPFYFVDESPIQVIKILEALSGKLVLQSSNLPNAKINFATKSRMVRSEAVAAFESLLSLNGIAIIPVGEKYLKAVPSDSVATQAPQFIMGSPSDLPVSLNFYTKLFELEYMEMDKLGDKLKPFLSAGKVSSAEVFPRSNAVLVTDTLANLQRIELLLKKLDTPAQVREDVGFVQLKNVSAEDMKIRLTNMHGDILKRYFENTTIEVDPRTNQVIIVTQKGNLPFIKNLIDGLDIPADPLLKSDVIYIKHGDAKDVVQVLNTVITGQQQAARNASNSKSRQSAATRAATRTKTAAGAKPPTPSKATRDTDSGMQFSEYVTTTADEWSNSIVVYGTPSDLLQVRDLVEKLDIQLYQVRIDVIITEVTLTDNQVSGLSTFGLSFGDTGSEEWPKQSGRFSGTTSTYNLSSNTNPAFKISANESGFDAVFNTAQENSNVKVLSSPSITTSHNKEAYVNVGQKYPIITSSTSDIVNTNTTKSSVELRDIGIKLTVTPRIGENGIVQMEVHQEVETIVDYTTIDQNQQPIIGTREAESFISVQSGETIVMAGLQQVDVSDKGGKVWLLGDLPVLGWLFSPSSSDLTRRELIIFIRPTVVKSSKIEDIMTDKAIANSSYGEEILDYFEDGNFYSRKELRDKERKFEDNRFYNRLWRRPWSLLVPPESKTVSGMLNDELSARKRADEEIAKHSAAANSPDSEAKSAEAEKTEAADGDATPEGYAGSESAPEPQRPKYKSRNFRK